MTSDPQIQARRPPIRLPPVKPGNAIVLALALVIAGGSLAASRIHLGAPNANGYESLTLTQLKNGSLSKRGRTVTLTLTSVRQHPAAYKVAVDVNATKRIRRTVKLASGARYTVTLHLGPAKHTRVVSATAVLTPGNWTPRKVNVSIPAS